MAFSLLIISEGLLAPPPFGTLCSTRLVVGLCHAAGWQQRIPKAVLSLSPAAYDLRSVNDVRITRESDRNSLERRRNPVDPTSF